jgi:hypothetical protein
MRVGSRVIGRGKCAHDSSRDGSTGGTCGGGQCNFHGSELIQILSLCVVYFTSESWLNLGSSNTCGWIWMYLHRYACPAWSTACVATKCVMSNLSSNQASSLRHTSVALQVLPVSGG